VDGFELPELSEALRAAVEETDKLGEMFEQEFDRTLSRMMLEWCALAPPLPAPPSGLQQRLGAVCAIQSPHGRMLCAAHSPDHAPVPALPLARCTNKDITRIAQCLDAHMLGVFVKTVLRVVSYLDVTREVRLQPASRFRAPRTLDHLSQSLQVLLGLNEFELFNRLDHHTDLLLGGLVTNESLYLRLAA
jgi:hypothetical protein